MDTFLTRLGGFIKAKTVGFWFYAGTAVLSLIAAIVYAAGGMTGNIEGFSELSGLSVLLPLLAFAFTLVAVVLDLLRHLLKLPDILSAALYFVPWVLFVLNFIAFLLFVNATYYYVSVVIIGIDLNSFSAGFMVSAVFFLLAFLLGIATLYLKPLHSSDKAEGAAAGPVKAV